MDLEPSKFNKMMNPERFLRISISFIVILIIILILKSLL